MEYEAPAPSNAISNNTHPLISKLSMSISYRFSGYMFMCMQRIVHRDLEPQNILLTLMVLRKLQTLGLQ